MKTSYNRVICFVFLLFIFNLLFFIQNCKSQWVKVSNGIGNKYAYSLADCGYNIFAGTYGYPIAYGLYKSTNNGTSWARTSIDTGSVFSLAVNGNYIFAGTGDSGVFLSTNNGTNWNQTSLNNRAIYSFAINGNAIFAGTLSNGVYVSTNNGASWTNTPLNNDWIYSMTVNGIYTFAGTIGHGVYSTTNNGTNWVQAGLYSHDVLTMAVQGMGLFAGSWGLFLSTNNGSSWSPSGFSNQWVLSLCVSGNYLFAGTRSAGFYVSSDNGVNWTLRNEGIVCNEVRSVCIVNNYIFAGTDSSVYRRPLGELVAIKPVSSQIPESFQLFQNYPNPFNPSTKIHFSIPPSKGDRGMNTRLIIYDILGREVVTLVNERFKPGSYEVEWDGSNFASGIYFYKLVAEDFVDVKKMVLFK